MKDSDGNQILRSNPWYINHDKLASFTGARGIPFRICATSTNCSVMRDQYVPAGGSWLQLDEQGVESDTKSSPGWIYFDAGYLAVYSSSNSVVGIPLANFTGQGNCIFGECAICISLASTPTGCTGSGLSATAGCCGTGIQCVQNSRQCQPYYYEETSCIGPSSVAPNWTAQFLLTR